MARKAHEVKFTPEGQGQKLISDPSTIIQFLNKAADELAKVDVLVRGTPIRVEARIVDSKIRGDSFYLDLADDHGRIQLEAGLTQAGSHECLLMIFMKGQYLVGMKSVFQGDDGQGLKFTVPNTVVRVQRRADVRFTIPGGYEIMLGLPFGRRRLLDVSEKGLSFSINSEAEGDMLKASGVLKRVELTLHGRPMVVDLEVKNVLGTKVGAIFRNIAEEDGDFLASYVYSQVAHLMF